jgi:hypothetical protein
MRRCLISRASATSGAESITPGTGRTKKSISPACASA